MLIEYRGGMKLGARRRGLAVASDQPEKGGGENTALAPSELFVASLGMRAGAYVLHFAARHNLPVEGMKIEVDYEYAADPRRIGRLEVNVKMPGSLSAQHQAALQRAAELCPVRQALLRTPEIKVTASWPRPPIRRGLCIRANGGRVALSAPPPPPS